MTVAAVVQLVINICLLWKIIDLLGERDRLRKQVNKQPKAKKEPAVEVETYGHPADPVATIRSKLPKVVYPFAWESAVEYNDAGHAILFVALQDIQTKTERGRVLIDLTHDMTWPGTKPTWETQYAKFSVASNRTNRFEKEFLVNALDPIRTLWRKETRPGPTSEETYRMQA